MPCYLCNRSMATRFTQKDLDRAHKGTSRANVREYLATLFDLGVVSYTSYVSDGHSDYFDEDGNWISSPAVHEPYEVADEADRDAAQRAIDAHLRRETDYFTFSKQLAAAGVCTWVMDTIAMTCAFCSTSGQRLIVDDA
jgi:uncharacterized protein YbcV (DUF1398 family)